MGAPERFLRRSVVVFKVLAWLSLVLQVIVGMVVLVMGGEAVPLGGIDVPARVVGVLNFIAAAIYFFLFMFIAHITQVLLTLSARRGAGGSFPPRLWRLPSSLQNGPLKGKPFHRCDIRDRNTSDLRIPL